MARLGFRSFHHSGYIMATKLKASTNSISAMAADDAKWRTDSDLRTMLECEAIEKDPKRLAAVQKLAKEKMMDMAKVASEGAAD